MAVAVVVGADRGLAALPRAGEGVVEVDVAGEPAGAGPTLRARGTMGAGEWRAHQRTAERVAERPRAENDERPPPPAAQAGRSVQGPSAARAPAWQQQPAATTKAKAAEPTAPKKAPAEKPARTHPPGAVSALGLSKVYGDRPALAALDLHVPYGESLALIGHNGSGKTTFLRLAAGLLDASDGSVLIDGHPAGSLPARGRARPTSRTPRRSTRTCRSGSTSSTSPGCTATTTGSRTRADLLDHLGLYDRADDLPTSFSRGLRQKASIAMAFIRPFDVLLVDEPFVGLDARGKAALSSCSTRRTAAERTLLVATHELSFLETRQPLRRAPRRRAALRRRRPRASTCSALVS